uniref:Uncharacterized protein n=1 Tax=Solanum demissum TaxID=50514 RepID=Q6L3P4_SOLDE|nr:hypothetical protein SDM1_42t00021 [Solanum demissum]
MTGSFGPNDTSLTLASRRMTGYLLPFLYLDGEALDWFRWMYRNKQFWDWKHFKEKLSLCFRARTTPESALAHSQITTILTLLQKAAIEDAIDSATTRVSEEIASALGDRQSSIANNFEVHPETFDTLIDTNLLLAGTTFVITFRPCRPVSLIPHDNVAAIAEFFPFVFNQSSLADFGDLAMCESVTDGLPTCHWFDTGQHVSPFIPFVFRHTKYGHHVSATEFDKNGYRPIIGAQAMKSGDSKMNQLFDAMSDKACKVFNVMSTSLLVRVLAETPKETGTIQQFHFKDKECLLISFGGQESIVSAAHSTHALPRRYFDVNSLYSVLSRQKNDLVASNNIYVDIIFMKSTILEDVSKREIQSNDVRNDVKHVKFNEEIRHDECLFPVDPGENLFMVKLGGTVKDNGWQVLVDVCALGAKNMPTLSVKPSSQIEPLGARGDKNLTVK